MFKIEAFWCRHNFHKRTEKDSFTRQFKKKVLEMFLSGPYSNFGDIAGGQRAAAELLGCSQATVCKRSGVDISPIKQQLKRQRRRGIAFSNPDAVTVIINYWVRQIFWCKIRKNNWKYLIVQMLDFFSVIAAELAHYSRTFKNFIAKRRAIINEKWWMGFGGMFVCLEMKNARYVYIQVDLQMWYKKKHKWKH